MRLVVFFILLALSAWNLLVLLPAVYLILRGGSGAGSSGGSLQSAFLRLPDLRRAISRTPKYVEGQPGMQEHMAALSAAATGAMPFPAAALAGWRRTQ